ncbi:unnamed protein product [Adineta ricciae]|uniref:polynucleotide adenylyltransferase n=1 Tax=Adineta ricciae TaxID=249248 RepID=A0A814LYD3_ADIRI|nr:unnamed protein product [Adineta ricciae]
MHVSNISLNSNNNSSKVYLTCEQIEKLKHVLDRSIPICSSSPSTFPTLNLTPRYFLRQVLWKLKENSIDISSIRLNGGAASYVLVNDPKFAYRDIDILIYINTPLSSEQKTSLFSSNNEAYSCDVWTIIKYIICSCLIEHIASTTSSSQQYTHHYLSTVLDTYTNKNIKISSKQDSWALLSLQNNCGQNLELKFVEHIKRQWQFSVDSFQINLESLLYEKHGSQQSNRHLSNGYKCPSISSITTTIKTKSLVIDAINGLTIIKKESDEQDDSNEKKSNNEKVNLQLTSTSPLQFGFFTPSSSPPDTIEEESNREFQTLATITTIATLNNHTATHESRSRLSKSSVSTLNDDSIDSTLQFHLSLNDDIDDGIVCDADDSANEDDDQVFRTPVDANSAPSSPATITATDMPSLLSSSLSSSSASSSHIEVYSVYMDVHQALDHLYNKLIATIAPETMRGGGLLKYCYLLAQNYKVHDQADMLHMQLYMCSRFFIDYKSIPEQIHVITLYVSTHILLIPITNYEQSMNSSTQRRTQNSKSSEDQNTVDNVRLCLLFFDHLSTVIRQSTVCLTHHDKEATLMMVEQLKHCYHYNYKHLFADDTYHQQRYHSYQNHNYHHQHRHVQHCSSSSSNSSRSSSPSSSSSNSYKFFRHNNNQRYQNSHHRHHNNQRTPTSYHPTTRSYSNQFQSNQPPLSNHYQQRRYQL